MSDQRIHAAPAGSAQPVLGRTLASLLDEGCALNLTTPAIIERTPEGGESSVTARELRDQADRVACALADAGLTQGDRVVMCLPPGVAFSVVDFACQILGIVDIPLYETCRPEDLAFILDETEARAVVVGGDEAHAKLAQVLSERKHLALILSTDEDAKTAAPHVRTASLSELLERGREILADAPEMAREFRTKVGPHDVATLIYTSGTTGQPKGVQLTHENLSYNGMTGFAEIKALTSDEVAMSILPLAHVFQRTMHYALVAHGWPIYFCEPTAFREGIQWARPTMFAAVPRVLEKIRESIELAGSELTGMKKRIYRWAKALADKQEMERRPGIFESLQLKLADRLVYSKWRQAVGGRLKVVICGGAALDPRIANFFTGWGIAVLQGFGLTETSTIVTFNRPRNNRAGTAGHPLPGVEVMIAEDGEILTRGPHITSGYFKRPDATKEAIDEDGWFHTGDIGKFDADGFLHITDRKKNLFKLSTGRYVAPQPIEMALTADPLVRDVLVTGVERKYACALIFPEENTLRHMARMRGLNDQAPIEELYSHPQVVETYQSLLDHANQGVADYAQAKRFALINAELSIDNGLLTPTLKIRRTATAQQFEAEIEALYEASESAEPANDSLIDL